MKRYSFLWATLVLLIGCKEKMSYRNVFEDPLIYSQTVKELNIVVKDNGFPPIVASRNYTYATIAAYEAMAIGDKRFKSLSGQLNGLAERPHVDTSGVNFQLAAIISFCKVGEAVTFPAGSMKRYMDKMDSLALVNGMSQEMLSATKNFADTISAYVLKWSKSDRYAQTRTAPKYNITDEEGRWVPTPPEYHEALEPNWNKIRPMVMDSANQFIPPRPPKFDMKNKNSEFYKWVEMVKNAGDSLTNEQKHIAAFWDDLGSKIIMQGHVMSTAKKFSPPGHWMSIVGIAAKQAKADFGNTVYAYAKTAIASFDAFIQCWDEKYRSNLLRPETAINKYIDPNWRPYLQTPPFPEYTCGHSTVSAAAAEVLTNVFGDNFAYTDSSELEFGIPNRSFKSFREAAIENNWARFYGGIHYHGSCIVSNKYGIKVADLVNNKLKMKN